MDDDNRFVRFNLFQSVAVKRAVLLRRHNAGIGFARKRQEVANSEYSAIAKIVLRSEVDISRLAFARMQRDEVFQVQAAYVHPTTHVAKWCAAGITHLENRLG
ncbi:hypothetical protein VI08_05565 [Luteibacter yeojuensis]|uniref:Uncharacterized protein n=1 Tax=Luteibacter yeojuensis TaxID=345309 RepID=A0A0F3KZD0_9GAMM|nr:hypothetical protein VI08_05565 [Luteibacter yeojuensis]